MFCVCVCVGGGGVQICEGGAKSASGYGPGGSKSAVTPEHFRSTCRDGERRKDIFNFSLAEIFFFNTKKTFCTHSSSLQPIYALIV